MQVGLRHINAGTVEWLKDAVRGAGRSRRSPALELCEREDWRNARGEPVLSAGHRAVRGIAERLGPGLPAARAPSGSRRECRAADFPDMSVEGPLESLGAVRLEPVSGDGDWRRWEAMMACHHPQGWARPPGGQLRYWIHAGAHGRLGGLCFASAGWHRAARDRAIGWSADARAENLPGLIRNHRFPLLPGVRVHGLASAALRLAAGCVAEHWRERYGVRPVMVCTYIGPGHDGCCYRAAGWRRCAGRTAGQPPGRTAAGPRRRVWLLPLDAKWRETLCREPERPPAPPVALHADERADWAEREYSRSTHPDGRVRDRIVAMGRKWQHSPGAGLPAVFPDRAGKKAAYRLLSNERVTMEHILEPHQAALVERCRQEAMVLAVQDTTTLNYDTLRATEGLVPLGGGGGGVSGLVAHVGLAMSAAGRALGVSGPTADFRGKEDTESARWLRGFDRSRELADACPDARVVSVCDREGDFWELLRRAADDPRQTFPVRASRSARRSVLSGTGDRTDLWEHMATMPRLTERTVEIAARGGGSARRKRTARLDIRAARVTLAAPADAADRRPVETLAVSVTEPDPPAGKEPLDWMLMCSRGEPDPETVREVVGWYEARWSIEEWFRVPRSGARIGDRQLDTADDLRKCLAFDAVTACRVLHLQRLARDRPDAPATDFVTEDEVYILYVRLLELQVIRARPPPGHTTIGEFVIGVAGLAGFHPRKAQPLPGGRKLWEGYIILKHSLNTYLALKKLTGHDTFDVGYYSGVMTGPRPGHPFGKAGDPVHDGPPAPESPCGVRPGKMGATIVEGEKTTADTTLRLLQKLERDYPHHRVIHVYLDNARHHHAKKPNRSRHGRTAASGRTSCRPTTPTCTRPGDCGASCTGM